MQLGMHFDRTIMFHRWIGRFVLLLIIVHALMYIPDYADSMLTLDNLWGLIAGFASLMLFVTSIEFMRRKHFEKFFWYASLSQNASNLD